MKWMTGRVGLWARFQDQGFKVLAKMQVSIVGILVVVKTEPELGPNVGYVDS